MAGNCAPCRRVDCNGDFKVFEGVKQSGEDSGAFNCTPSLLTQTASRSYTSGSTDQFGASLTAGFEFGDGAPRAGQVAPAKPGLKGSASLMLNYNRSWTRSTSPSASTESEPLPSPPSPATTPGDHETREHLSGPSDPISAATEQFLSQVGNGSI